MPRKGSPLIRIPCVSMTNKLALLDKTIMIKAIAMLGCVVLGLFGPSSKASPQDLAYQTLMGASALECKFCLGKSAEVTEAGGPVEFKKDGTIIASKGDWSLLEGIDKRFPALTFRQIYHGEGLSCTAQLSGNTGNIGQVEGFLRPGVMTFVETMPMGGSSFTSIFAEFDGKQELIAVHSRHFKFFSKIVASQYYGSCRPIAP
jgi:hypothetical protein